MAQRALSCKRRIHNYVRNNMLMDLLGDWAITAMPGHTILILKTDILNVYASILSHRMMASALLIVTWLITSFNLVYFEISIIKICIMPNTIPDHDMQQRSQEKDWNISKTFAFVFFFIVLNMIELLVIFFMIKLLASILFTWSSCLFWHCTQKEVFH